ncbi:MAG TPA: UvrD-helicase domain-containing protein [Planctomycetota bacterium]|nr:UvrD-helicase domain-containing protein [Planctomycetota bacterium]
MTRMPWDLTHEQQRAALLTGQAMLASAGAGSGKTAVMAVRYCACLLDRDDGGRLLTPERVLAMTFTREAAANLRARIDRTLRAVVRRRRFSLWRDGAIEAHDLDDERLHHLRECLAKLPGAPITTLDGFCLGLVREHAAELGRDPELAAPEDVAWRACRDEAWSRLAGERGDELPMLIEHYGEHTVRARVIALSDQASTAPTTALLADRSDAFAEVMRRRATHLAAAVAALADARQAMKATSALARDLAAIAATPASDAVGFGAWVALVDALAARDPQAKEHLRRMQDAIDHPHVRASSGARPDKEKRRCRGSLVSLSGFDPGFEDELADRADAFAAVAARFAVLVDEVAERHGVGGFARVQAEALTLLEDAATRRRLGALYRHVLLDEAQDLNRLQGRLVDLLRDGGSGRGSARVFVVGDHRQSIYGFRHAAPEIFVAWERSIEDGGGGVASLEQNFRSHPDLVESIKLVIGQRSLRAAFRPDAISPGRVHADFAPGVPFVCWRVDVLPVPAAPIRRGALIGTQAQAAHIARLIGASLGEGRNPEDHAILVRTRARMRAYAQALERAGIAYDTDFPGGLVDAQECHDLEVIIRLTLNPHDRQALAVALSGPWGVADAQDRTALVEALSQGPALGWAYACQRTALGAVVAALAPTLAREGVAAALRQLIADPRLAARYAQLPLARRRFANLLTIADEERAAGRPLDGHAFVARLAERRRLGVDVGEATGEAIGGRGVRLMTVHGAKGLEWPVVFIPDCDRDFGLRDLRGPALAQVEPDGLTLTCLPAEGDDDGAIGLRAGLAQEAIRARMQDEEARLFYVACTRARERLHCLVATDCVAPDECGLVHRWGDWLVGAAVDWRAVAVDPGERFTVPVATGETIPTLPELRTDPDQAAPIRSVTELVGLLAAEEPVLAGAGAGDAAPSVARELGTAVHEALARHGPGMAPTAAAAALDRLRGRVDAARLDLIIARLADADLLPGYWRADARLVEQPVVARVGGVLVVGICDLLLKHGDGWHLYDWKTGDAADHAAAQAQVQVYAHLLRPHLDAPLVAAALVDVERARLVPVAIGGPGEQAATVQLAART